MLDFDSLAESRARDLNQDVDQWRAALWGHDFQLVSQSMSDGEVEALINACPSVNHVHKVLSIVGSLGASGPSPFAAIVAEANKQSLGLVEWIVTLD